MTKHNVAGASIDIQTKPHWNVKQNLLQLTLVIPTSLISINRLSTRENLVPVLTWKSNNR